MKRPEVICKTTAFLLVCVLVLAAGLRLWQLDRPALWEDDYFNLNRGLMGLGDMFHAQKYAGPTDTFHDYQPPLYYALLHIALAVSKSSVAARLVSFVAGMLALLGLWRAGASLFGLRAGLFALTLAGLSLFHIDASRAIKTYSIYFCAGAWSLHFLYEAVIQGKSRFWIGWVITSAAMVYSSFLGVPGLAAQMLFAMGALALGARRRETGWKAALKGFSLAATAVLLLCLPWAEAVVFIREMFHNPAIDPLASMNLTKIRELAEGFLGHVFVTPGWLWAGLPLLALVGAAGAVAGGRTKGLVLVLLWALLPAAAVLTSRTEMNSVLSTRHFYNIYGLLVLLGGAGVAAVSGLVSDKLAKGRSEALPLLLGTAICLAISVHGLTLLPQYYARSISFDRDVAFWLFANRPRGDFLDVQGWKRSTKRYAMNWYLPEWFRSAGNMDKPGYRRMLVLENTLERGDPAPRPGAVWSRGFAYGPFGTRVNALGMANRSPIPALANADGLFRYADDYSGLDLHRDASELRNASTDTRLGVLLPSAWSEPGSVLYHFVLPKDVKPLRAEAVLEAVLYKRHPSSPSNAAIEVWTGPSLGKMRKAGTVTVHDFPGPPSSCQALEEIPLYGACSKIKKTLNIGQFLDEGEDIYLRLDLLPGREEGYLFADAFAVTIVTPPGAVSSEWASSRELQNLLVNNNVRPWKPGAASLDGIFAFAAREGLAKPGSSMGTPEDLQAFQGEHPGLAPVHVLHDADRQPVAFFFDPPLSLTGGRPEALVAGSGPFQVKGLVLTGRMNVPSLLVGDKRVDIPVAAPRGSVLLLNPGGRGKLIWSPDFSKAVFQELDFSSADNLRPAPDGDNDGGLTCREERPCHFMARFVSALPVRRVRLEWYPRVVADPSGNNVIRLSYSTDDGRTFRPIEEFSGGGTGKWTGMFHKHARVLDFPVPINHFLLKAELSGEAAQLWSHARPVDRMWLEADLDARSVPSFDIPAGEFRLGLATPEGNDVVLRFQEKAVPMFDDIKDWR